MTNTTKTSGKMTLTFDQDIYGQLLATYQPRIIETEEENEYFLSIIEDFMHCENLSPEEDKLFDLLVKLVEDFEREFYPIDSSTPLSRLNHLLEAREMDKRDLLCIFDSGEELENILAGRMSIDPLHANRLAEFFHVNPSLFVV